VLAVQPTTECVAAPGASVIRTEAQSALPRMQRFLARCDAEGMRKWILAWVGASVLGVANGVARETTYSDRVGDDAAHVISTGMLLMLLGGYMWLLQRRWPLESRREALSVGATWTLMTIAFEFGFGHWVDGDSWSELLENYDVTAGKVWIFVPVAMAAGPELARRLSAHQGDDVVHPRAA
jgi:hypothetical protein